MEFVIISWYPLIFCLFSISLNYTSELWFVFPINTRRHAIMNQSEVHLHSGYTVHFHPTPPRVDNVKMKV